MNPALTQPQTTQPSQSWWQNDVKRGFFLSGLTLIATIAGFMAQAQAQTQLSWVLFAIAFLAGGIPAAREAIHTLFHERKLDVDLLMVVAALGAASVGQAGDGAILLFLFSLSNTLQDWAMGRTRRAIEALMALNPEGANVLLPSGQEVWRHLSEIVPGDVLMVRPGERFAADGVVLDGFSDVDESALTGESVPVDKQKGDAIKSGTLNGHGVLQVKVERPAGESTLAKLIGLVEDARAAKSKTERFAEAFEGPYSVGVLLSVPVVFAVAHYAFGLEAAQAWYRAMTFLVVASPCAVVISTPAAVLSAMGAGARRGALFKSGAALESLSQVKIVALDKTGTLTEGKMRLERVSVLEGDEDQARQLAASLEHYSEHPIAEAIVAGWGKALLAVSDVRTVRGRGILGRLENGDSVWIGNRPFAADQGANLGTGVEAQLTAFESNGFTTSLLGRGNRVIALLGVADSPRPEAKTAIDSLKKRGIRVVMLTGDRKAVADHVANQVGIKEVHAELLPEDKLRLIGDLEHQGKVMMVGDGVNDAPALNAASVGVSMAQGSDVSLESADLVLMKNDLSRLVGAYSLARSTAATVRFNLTFALLVIVVVGILALLGKVPLPIGVIAHEGGTIFVVTVGLRLLAHKVLG